MPRARRLILFFCCLLSAAGSAPPPWPQGDSDLAPDPAIRAGVLPNGLLLHVFDMVEGSDWSRLIRDRYEALLLEAFA